MEETFRRATRIRALPRVAEMERKMSRGIKDTHTPDGIFAIIDVPLVLFAIGFENPDQALYKRWKEKWLRICREICELLAASS